MRVLVEFRRPFSIFASITVLIELTLFALCFWGIAWQHRIPVNSGWMPEARGDRWIITEIDDDGPAAGKLMNGDELVSINGSNRVATFGLPLAIAGQGRKDYTIQVRRSGTQLSWTLPFWHQPDQAWRSLSCLLLALINFGVAVWIGAARPSYGAAQVAFFLFMGMARTFASSSLLAFPPALSGLSLWFAAIFTSHNWQPLECAVAYDFALRFPESLRNGRFPRLLRWFFYYAALLLFGISALLGLANILDMTARSALLPHWFPLEGFDSLRPSRALGALALFCVPPVLTLNYRQLQDPLARRRVRWVALGLSLALTPVALGIAAYLFLVFIGKASASTHVESFLDVTTLFFFALVPITFAYAIVRHKILGIRVVIRKGLQYLLARNVLRIVLWLPLIAIAVDLALHPHEPLADFLLNRSWWVYLLLIVSASLTLRYRNRLQIWVDRKFFRSAYEEEVILSDLIDSMQACENSDEVARVVAEKLQVSLHPSSTAVLYRKEAGGLFTVGYPQDKPIGLEFRGILNERVQDALQAHRSARTFTEISALLKEQESPSNDVLLNTLLTPITGANGSLLGVLLLGEKKSEQAYSHRDRRFLQAVATQMGLIFEMLKLKEQVREEGRVRVEVLGRLDQENIQLVLECPLCGACYSSPVTHCATDGTPVSLTLPIERVIEGKYRLERRIGTGGMGAVYEASDLRLERIVAVKVMTGRLFGNTSALRRFEREARAAARLQHPNIVSIYDFGSLRGGGAYLVMERITGRSWRTELTHFAKIRPKRAAGWFDQLCDAVAHAHSRGIVHRDLKPENLLVSFSNEGAERVTVLDFGVAKLRSLHENPEPELTSADRVIGTYGYMSPEQRSGEMVDGRSDIYAVAVLVIETLTNNRPPSSGASKTWLKEALQWADPTPVSDQLIQLLERALRESVEERLHSIYDLQHELIPLLYTCPPLLSTKASGAAGADTETMPG
jgi:eukaryotic-like serine/threonine-protein kinase